MSDATPDPLKGAKEELPAVPAQPAKKDSTIELPMYDLAESLGFVTAIQDKALEAVAMPKVAAGMGYTHPSSTPFYRRMVASRLFGLCGKTGAELTVRARAYLKPDSEDARPKALQEAVTGIAAYAEEIQRYSGKKLNTQFIANSFATKYGLTDACGLVCARAFESSLKVAGLVGADGTLGQQSPAPKANGTLTEAEAEPPPASGTTRTHILPLQRQRSVSVTAPVDISQKEINRLKKWLEVTLLIDWTEEPDTSENP